MSLWRWKRYKIKKSVDNNNILNIFVNNDGNKNYPHSSKNLNKIKKESKNKEN